MVFLYYNISRVVMRTMPPLIKFRKGGKSITGSVGSAVKLSSGVDDENTPLRYQRKLISPEEIEYINYGGPPVPPPPAKKGKPIPVEDILQEIPLRYQRKPLTKAEIDYINCGGPA